MAGLLGGGGGGGKFVTTALWTRSLTNAITLSNFRSCMHTTKVAEYLHIFEVNNLVPKPFALKNSKGRVEPCEWGLSS